MTMARTRMAVVLLALVPLVAAASPARREARVEERLEHAEKRHRLRQVLELSDLLSLNNAQALKLEETLRKFDERRRPLRKQVRESARILFRASRGDSEALSQVDTAALGAFEARERIAALDKELYQTLAKDLPEEKRAKLALSLARTEGRKKGRWEPEKD
ncbi:hypothetical protein [Comamonas sp. JC664]|uniref:hypothetical protein n=1 Tax=Comamonas sp. JC664 TaxID=2801917 RepID=UPI00191E3FED|nr:hypothetical protein [Comamonas sp. JC664]MBL0693233.1 hypothetical protein [Comamonas sp. JC664]GHG97526.1 hypothetical protein GCM10012319_62550 [Comamonas sp. KCTC 72670]